ncbi:dephospho-CoA kinase [Clostridium sp. MSJ-11]|uniref:Dephospho-CoA kinase n=1 Tax=Clostridium mobile TaxID=2841512 RepID=A0ABS6EL81_9CLOT|nr:dephospho-CoA kinase [Clostridium mobile]MBU5485557.1 dephospho-CoA kinase [Clostridium mobile]
MKQNKIFKIGLTGGIGSGKSTVSRILKERGISIIDCDVISRDVLKKYPNIIEDIEEKYGSEFVDENGNLKRREFGSFIFSSEEKRREFESIIIPYINKEIYNMFDKCQCNGEKICVLDAPTLFEQNMHLVMDLIVVVWVDEKTQFNRVKSRDKLDDKEVINRINAQISLNKKREMAHFVIDNTKTIDETEMQIDTLIQFINDLRGVEKAVEEIN